MRAACIGALAVHLMWWQVQGGRGSRRKYSVEDEEEEIREGRKNSRERREERGERR